MYHRVKFGGSLISDIAPLNLLDDSDSDSKPISTNRTRSGLLIKSYNKYMPVAMDTYNDVINYVDDTNSKKSDIMSFINNELNKIKNKVLP